MLSGTGIVFNGDFDGFSQPSGCVSSILLLYFIFACLSSQHDNTHREHLLFPVTPNRSGRSSPRHTDDLERSIDRNLYEHGSFAKVGRVCQWIFVLELKIILFFNCICCFLTRRIECPSSQAK